MVHTFTECGYNIAVDCASGSVHVVDEVALELIDNYEKAGDDGYLKEVAAKHSVSLEEIKECVDDLKELERQGKLFSEDKFRPDVDKLAKRSTVVKALCLHVAHTCNLDCEYCFASQGKYHGERALMSFEVGKRALDFLVENSGDRHNLEVDFFGGEPLMNWQVVKDLVAYARSIEQQHDKCFRFTLTTNGMLVDDDVIEFSNSEMDNVVMSLDGRKEINDHFRKTAGGVGSFDIIVPKFVRFAKARGEKDYYIRGTFTHNNPDFMKDIEVMLDLGFDRLSMEPVVCPPDSPYALTEEDKKIVCRQYELLAEKMIERRRAGTPFVFYHYMLDLEHGPCIYKRLSGCGSGTEYMAVTPTGELYPCHQFVGDKDYLMGDVFNGVTNTAVRDKFKRCNVYSKPECADCWARLYCSGGCAANSYHATGDINGIYSYGCDLFKKRMQCAIAVNASALIEE
ncbi:MAG: thioether cross-link-forming SCIFF peptide maturase [Acutalibacteraceae bacterium]